MARIQLFDPIKQIFTNVRKEDKQKFLDQGLTERRPSQQQIKTIESSARKGVQKFTTPSGGTTTTRPIAPKLPGATTGIATDVVKPTTTRADIETGIVDTQFAKQKERLNALLAKGKGELRQEERQIEPRFREEERKLRTADTMAREGTRKLAAQFGAGGSDIQSDISQNVITGEARAAGAARESNQRADIEARKSQLELDIASGISTAESEAELVKLENDLRRIGIQEERDTFRVDQERQDFITNIDSTRDHTQAIQDIMNDGDPSNDWKIPFHESARAKKIDDQGLDPATGQPLPRDTTPDITSNSAMDLWDQLGVANEAVSRALGVAVGTRFTRRAASNVASGGLTQSQLATNARYMVTNGIALTGNFAKVLNLPEGFVDPNFSGGGGPEEELLFSDEAIETSIQNAIDASVVGIEDFDITAQMQTDAVKDWLIRNGDDIEDLQLQNIVRTYNLTDEDIDDLDNTSLPFGPFN